MTPKSDEYERLRHGSSVGAGSSAPSRLSSVALVVLGLVTPISFLYAWWVSMFTVASIDIDNPTPDRPIWWLVVLAPTAVLVVGLIWCAVASRRRLDTTTLMGVVLAVANATAWAGIALARRSPV